ncbi:Rieske 2Fe-2S domain-containing protein [Novosphingobium bradum]|uniref:Rieske 2Fe-2S domain-containing protein n=1 Tax=Novosphingobium bradum TaxID=1737444 RepID=A0ABV7IR27_9SPHN
MITEEQNRLLTHVEGDAPLGQMMRQRYWIPCARSAALVPDGAPQHVRLLGSDYVAFRATDGRIGFFDEACPHRGASLVLAQNKDCALRCLYHAWKIDVSGTVVDIPSEGERGEAIGARIKVNKYPTFEGGGMLWVFLGDGPPPPRPPLPFLDLDESRVWVSRSISPSNWFQGVEGTIDSVHVGTMHQSWIAQHFGKASADKPGEGSIGLTLNTHPRYEVQDTPYGMKAAAIRTLADGKQYVRVTSYVMPFVSLVPASGSDRTGTIFIAVPRDNTHHILFWGFWNEDGPRMESEKQMTVGTRDPDNWVTFDEGPNRTWGQDREAMARGHFTGFTRCLVDEDLVLQASQGVIQDRTKENLVSSDVGIARLRRRMLDEIAAFQRGEPAADVPDTVRPLDTVQPADYVWRELA